MSIAVCNALCVIDSDKILATDDQAAYLSQQMEVYNRTTTRNVGISVTTSIHQPYQLVTVKRVKRRIKRASKMTSDFHTEDSAMVAAIEEEPQVKAPTIVSNQNCVIESEAAGESHKRKRRRRTRSSCRTDNILELEQLKQES